MGDHDHPGRRGSYLAVRIPDPPGVRGPSSSKWVRSVAPRRPDIGTVDDTVVVGTDIASCSPHRAHRALLMHRATASGPAVEALCGPGGQDSRRGWQAFGQRTHSMSFVVIPRAVPSRRTP